MLTPPEGLTDETLVQVLAEHWGHDAVSMEYRAVGFGSHHWEAVDAGGVRRFVTVDDLDARRRTEHESRAAVFARFRSTFVTARALHDAGAGFVVAPLPTRAGDVLVPVGPRYAMSLYPLVEGEHYLGFEGFQTPEHRHGVVDLLVALHGIPPGVYRHALVEDFSLALRDVLESSLTAGGTPHLGPYAERTSALVAGNAATFWRALERHDRLVDEVRRMPGPMVLTHGEPHPGNTVRTAAGWVLVDWDTVLVAPPERDLWSLDPGDGSVIDAYARATGTALRPAALDLYRLRWDLADSAAYVARLRASHTGSRDDEKSWDGLCVLVERLAQPTP